MWVVGQLNRGRIRNRRRAHPANSGRSTPEQTEAGACPVIASVLAGGGCHPTFRSPAGECPRSDVPTPTNLHHGRHRHRENRALKPSPGASFYEIEPHNIDPGTGGPTTVKAYATKESRFTFDSDGEGDDNRPDQLGRRRRR